MNKIFGLVIASIAMLASSHVASADNANDMFLIVDTSVEGENAGLYKLYLSDDVLKKFDDQQLLCHILNAEGYSAGFTLYTTTDANPVYILNMGLYSHSGAPDLADIRTENIARTYADISAKVETMNDPKHYLKMQNAGLYTNINLTTIADFPMVSADVYDSVAGKFMCMFAEFSR